MDHRYYSFFFCFLALFFFCYRRKFSIFLLFDVLLLSFSRLYLFLSLPLFLFISSGGVGSCSGNSVGGRGGGGSGSSSSYDSACFGFCHVLPICCKCTV